MKKRLVDCLLFAVAVLGLWVTWSYYLTGDLRIMAWVIILMVLANVVGQLAIAFTEFLAMYVTPPKRDEHEPDVSPFGIWWRRSPHLRSLLLGVSLIASAYYFHGVQPAISMAVTWTMMNLALGFFGDFVDKFQPRAKDAPIE